MNLKNFLEENELEEFFAQVFLSKSKVLLLEGIHDGCIFEHKRKMHINEAFLQE